jgi:CTP-dependent riboflavin kinase
VAWISLNIGVEMKVKGKVVSGFERGAYFISIYAAHIKRLIDMKPYPGTLNLELGKEIEIKHHLKIPRFRHKGVLYGWVGLTKARINGEEVYIVFPEKARHTRDVVEVISGKYLRGAMKLKDGTELTLMVE